MESHKLSSKRIAVIPGDGIGQEVIPQALKVIRASGANVELSEFDWGADRYLRDGMTVPPDGFAMLGRDFDAILAGAFGDPRVKNNIHAKEILLGMRFQMDLYANVRPVQLLDAGLCPLKGIEPKDIDFVVIRENTEGVYTDAGGVFKKNTPDEIAVQEEAPAGFACDDFCPRDAGLCALEQRQRDGGWARRFVQPCGLWRRNGICRSLSLRMRGLEY